MIELELEDILNSEHRDHGAHINFLYKILEERVLSPDENISLKVLPSWQDHVTFVADNVGGYTHWYVITNMSSPLQMYGAVYVTSNKELGIYISKPFRKNGYANIVIAHLIEQIGGDFYANINPNNKASINFFGQLGFELVQHTYKLVTPERELTLSEAFEP